MICWWGRRFVGMEYVVVTSTAPSLFVIHKRERTSPTEGEYLSHTEVLVEVLSTWTNFRLMVIPSFNNSSLLHSKRQCLPKSITLLSP